MLEPSFGGCGFLSSAQARLSAIGCKAPWHQLFGCDVDSKAFNQHLRRLIPSGVQQAHFLRSDFLKLRPEDFGVPGFTAVLGNPPYVSHHNMFKAQKVSASRSGVDTEFKVSGVASLWAYFIFHSTRFLLNGGRMGWLLPGSTLQANYATKLLGELGRRFQHVAVISLEEQLFTSDGIKENTQFLFCEGFGLTPRGPVKVKHVADLDRCFRLVRRQPLHKWRGVTLNGRATEALLPSGALSEFKELSAGPSITRLGDIAELAIGIVTGANKLFILNEQTARLHKLPLRSIRPIFAKFAVARGIKLLKVDFEAAKSAGQRCLLVQPGVSKQNGAVNAYFQAVPKKLVQANVTFAKRPDWRIPDDERIPDAFLSYMHHLGPRLVLNPNRVNSTNTIHRIYFRQGVSRSIKQLAAISILSTFSQISAEIEGRSYGDGVLKHELGEAARIQLILPTNLSAKLISRMLDSIDGLLRKGKRHEATTRVDRFLASASQGRLSAAQFQSLQNTLKGLRSRRQKKGQ